jgi:hypothetical protein
MPRVAPRTREKIAQAQIGTVLAPRGPHTVGSAMIPRHTKNASTGNNQELGHDGSMMAVVRPLTRLPCRHKRNSVVYMNLKGI